MPDGDLHAREAPRLATPALTDAFEALYRRHFDEVLTLLRRLGVHDHQLEDAAQDVFVVVHRKVAGFEGRARFRTWLFVIAHHVASRYRRTSFRAERRHRRLAEELDPSQCGPDDVVEKRQATALLHAFLDTLPPEQRGAFVLGEIERLPRRELGEALGVSPNTAYSRLRLARERFTATFAEQETVDTLLERCREPQPDPAQRRAVWALVVARLSTAAPAASVAPTSIAIGVIAIALTTIVGARVLRAEPPRPDAARIVASSEPALVAPERSTGVRSGDETPPTPAAVEPAITPAPAPVETAATRARATPRPPAEPIATDLPAELRALADARSTLVDGHPDEALAMIRKHAKTFAGGALAIDREVLRIDALCASGREDAARRAVQAFVRAHGGTPQAARVQASCGAG